MRECVRKVEVTVDFFAEEEAERRKGRDGRVDPSTGW